MKILDGLHAVVELTVGTSHEGITQGIHQSRRREIMVRIAMTEETNEKMLNLSFNHILLIEVLEAKRE